MQTTFVSNGRNVRLKSFVPETPGRHPAILLLHGSGGNVDYWLTQVAPLATRLHCALFALHYLDSTGSLRAEPAQFTDGIHVPLWLDASQSALTLIANNPAVNPARLAIVGISLGAFMALALATDKTRPLKAIVEISGGLVPPWSDRIDRTFPPTLILHGTADTVIPVSFAQTLAAELTRLNVPHQSHILPGEGHWFTPAASLSLLRSIDQFLSAFL